MQNHKHVIRVSNKINFQSSLLDLLMIKNQWSHPAEEAKAAEVAGEEEDGGGLCGNMASCW